tara:strand:- start:77189 stop:78529 length:1341 start_codon:yes stop_codon:yes gene_type:complete
MSKLTTLKKTIETNSREALIDLSRVLASAFEKPLFNDPQNIPLILISGTMNGGKSMIIEAMMKELLDEYDAADMKKPTAPKQMFIERKACDALWNYCQAVGHTMNKKVMYGFDRVTSTLYENAQQSLIQSFKKAASDNKIEPVGAIFRSSSHVEQAQPWLVIKLDGEKGWGRTLEIEVRNSKLLHSPRFQMVWEKLTADVTRNYEEILHEVSWETPWPELFVSQSHFRLNDDNKQGYEQQLLKFLYWNHQDFGLEKSQMASIIAKASDMGADKAVTHLLEWAETQDDQAFINMVGSEKSSLSRIFHKFVATDKAQLNYMGLAKHLKNALHMKYKLDPEAHKLDVQKLIDKLSDTNLERRDNFVHILSSFSTDKELSFALNARSGTKDKTSVLNTLLRDAPRGLKHLQATLEEGAFPQTLQRLNKTLSGKSSEHYVAHCAPQVAFAA